MPLGPRGAISPSIDEMSTIEPRPGVLHRRDRGLDAVERAGEVDREDRVPVLPAVLVDGAPPAMPALFKRTSSLPYLSTAVATAALQSSVFVTSRCSYTVYRTFGAICEVRILRWVPGDWHRDAFCAQRRLPVAGPPTLAPPCSPLDARASPHRERQTSCHTPPRRRSPTASDVGSTSAALRHRAGARAFATVVGRRPAADSAGDRVLGVIVGVDGDAAHERLQAPAEKGTGSWSAPMGLARRAAPSVPAASPCSRRRTPTASKVS